MNSHNQLEFDFMSPKYIQMEFNFDSVPSELIKVLFRQGRLFFTYEDKVYECVIGHGFSREYSYWNCRKINVIINNKLYKTDSLSEFYLLYHYIVTLGYKVEYHKRIYVSDIDPFRSFIEPDFYLIDEDKYVEFHPDPCDGKFDYYKWVANKLKLRIEYIDANRYLDIINYEILDSNIVKDPSFIYNFDTNSYVVPGKINYFHINDLIDLLISKNIKIDENMLIDSTKSIREKIRLSLDGHVYNSVRLGVSTRKCIDYIYENGFDRTYKIDEFRNYFTNDHGHMKLAKLNPVFKYFKTYGINIRVTSRKSK